MSEVKTEVSSASFDDIINAFDGAAGAGNIITSDSVDPIDTSDDTEKKEFFKKSTVDTDYLDEPRKKKEVIKNTTSDDSNDDDDDDEPLPNPVKPSTLSFDDVDNNEPKEKSNFIPLMEKLLDKGLIFEFEDGKPLEEFTNEDYEELLEANIKEAERRGKEDKVGEFYESLPKELQYAAEYVANGGKDMRGLFQALAQVEEVRNLNPAELSDAESINKAYLEAQGWDEADIKEQLEEWKDLNKLETNAKKFKPKLDSMHEEIVQSKIKEQEHRKSQQQEAAKIYVDNVYTTLKDGVLGDIKLDKKTQSMLYSGMVQNQYPSISGKPTNLLGHLLEKYQFVEPDYDKVIKALWVLTDEEGFVKNIKEKAGNDVVGDTVRTLKTEQSRRKPSSSSGAINTNTKRQTQNPGNFFKKI